MSISVGPSYLIVISTSLFFSGWSIPTVCVCACVWMTVPGAGSAAFDAAADARQVLADATVRDLGRPLRGLGLWWLRRRRGAGQSARLASFARLAGVVHLLISELPTDDDDGVIGAGLRLRHQQQPPVRQQRQQHQQPQLPQPDEQLLASQLLRQQRNQRL